MQSERIYGIYNSTLTITPSGGSAVDCKPDHVRWVIEINAQTEDATAAVDTWSYPLITHYNWRMTLEIFPSAATSGGSTLAALIDALRTNQQVSIVAAHAPPTGTKKFDKFTGSGIVESVSVSSQKGPVTHTYQIIGQGALTRSAHDA